MKQHEQLTKTAIGGGGILRLKMLHNNKGG